MGFDLKHGDPLRQPDLIRSSGFLNFSLYLLLSYVGFLKRERRVPRTSVMTKDIYITYTFKPFLLLFERLVTFFFPSLFDFKPVWSHPILPCCHPNHTHSLPQIPQRFLRIFKMGKRGMDAPHRCYSYSYSWSNAFVWFGHIPILDLIYYIYHRHLFIHLFIHSFKRARKRSFVFWLLNVFNWSINLIWFWIFFGLRSFFTLAVKSVSVGFLQSPVKRILGGCLVSAMLCYSKENPFNATWYFFSFWYLLVSSYISLSLVLSSLFCFWFVEFLLRLLRACIASLPSIYISIYAI